MERGFYVRHFTLRVVDEAGAAVQGARIKTLLPAEAPRVDDCVTSFGGQCSIRVLSPFLAQDVSFFIEAATFANQRVSRNEADERAIVLHRGRTLQVTVLSSGPLVTPLLMWFFSAEGQWSQSVPAPGNFEVSGVPVGELRVTLYESAEFMNALATRAVDADDASAVFSVEPRRVEAQLELGHEPADDDLGLMTLRCGSFPEQRGPMRPNRFGVVAVFGYAPPGPCTIEAAGRVSAPFSPPALVVLPARM